MATMATKVIWLTIKTTEIQNGDRSQCDQFVFRANEMKEKEFL